jgi:hypothetical protein
MTLQRVQSAILQASEMVWVRARLSNSARRKKPVAALRCIFRVTLIHLPFALIIRANFHKSF